VSQTRIDRVFGDIICMRLETFIQLCERIRATEVVNDAYRSTLEEQVSIFLHIIVYNVKNQSILFFSIGLEKQFLITFTMY